ncbi:Predicted dehydrogenase [Acetomicrobium thermoterrenum DSM 13490]|uniref:Predicted dehydrogenase n=1 Tax=Acetomicrobium thermoterrenum DSM 13490 TaxID=1120987 RepID=A0A1H3HJU8_9BACT|nr:Gfo/Idh/MocA family oxidoreductase [Acetomicrobium thermoterrenum]SDY15712.1 Predicted dehydrogenase [Acetomicrobium thermoterrenum DSM 13490]
MSYLVTYGMVGGSKKGQIGKVHRKAINLHGKAKIVCGAFSRNFNDTLDLGKELNISEERLYKNYEEMAEQERSRPDKIDFVSIVTPNKTHYEISKKFLECGINVMCEKPFTCSSQEAEELRILAEKNDLLLGISYSFTGYSMIRYAREMIRRGEIGEVRFVNAQYLCDWMAKVPFRGKNKQQDWRSDPKLSGISNCVADIGSHVENLIYYITGLRVESLSARIDHFIEQDGLDDNASILVNYNNGARGIYWTSQVAIGHENNLNFGIYGTKGSIEWSRENANFLKVSTIEQPFTIVTRGNAHINDYIKQDYVTPGGHTEGYIDAFGRIYDKFISSIIQQKNCLQFNKSDLEFQTAELGISGMRFIEKCIESAIHEGVWVNL